MDINKVKNRENRIFKIYCLKDPRDLKIKYIGVTVSSLSQRLSQHIYDSKNNKGTYKRNWIKNLLKINKKPIIALLEYCTYKNWEQKEICWIKRFNNLTNSKKGGSGLVIDRFKDSIEKSARGHWKAIIAIDSNKNILHFKSLKEACNILSIPLTSVSEVVRGGCYSAYGYHFITKEKYFKGYENSVRKIKKYKKYTLFYNKKPYTIKELSVKLKCSRTLLNLIANNKRNWKNSIYFSKEDTLEILVE